jgi:hypothetical protein
MVRRCGYGRSLPMSPYTKAALFAVRLIAAAFIICSFCLYSSDLFLWLSDHPLQNKFGLVLKAIPLLIGLALLWKSHDIAEQLTKDLD